MKGALRLTARYLRLVPERSSLPELDGIRALAIILVMGFHAADSFVPPRGMLLPVGDRWDLATPWLNGWAGVNLFFVLSGFLITHHLIRRWRGPVGPRELRRYLAKRWLRIVPTYYAVLVFVSLVSIPHFEVSRDLVGLRIAYHLLFLQDYLPSSILGPFWSLGVEEKFYLVAPVIFLTTLSMGTPSRALLLLGAIASIPLVLRVGMATGVLSAGVDRGFLETWRDPFHLNLDALAAGAACAWIYAHPNRFVWLRTPRARALCWWGGWSAAAALLSTTALLVRHNTFDRVFAFPLFALGFGLLLLGVVLNVEVRGSWLRRPWAAVVSKLSYSLYLVHVIVMHFTWGVLREWTPVASLAPIWQLGVFIVPYAAASVGAALLVHYVVEKPGLLLKDRLDRSPPQASSSSMSISVPLPSERT